MMNEEVELGAGLDEWMGGCGDGGLSCLNRRAWQSRPTVWNAILSFREVRTECGDGSDFD